MNFVSLDFVLGNIKILGKQNLLSPSGPVIKCEMFHDWDSLLSYRKAPLNQTPKRNLKHFELNVAGVFITELGVECQRSHTFDIFCGQIRKTYYFSNQFPGNTEMTIINV